MSDVHLHRADEARWIERQPFFRKDLNTLTPAQLKHVRIWGDILSERGEMLPSRAKAPQSRWGLIVQEIAV